MKKSAAILGIMLLVLLSACRPNGETGGGTTLPTQQPGNGPVEESTPPPPVETKPQDTAPPSNTTVPTTYLTAEELSKLAITWSETYQDRFAGYSAFHIDHAYWFAEYAGAAVQFPFTAADGGDGTVFFLPGDAASDPASAAAIMLGQNAEQLILVDREQVMEEVTQRMAVMAEQKLTQETALSAFLKDIQYIPALMEDMWYCVSAEDTGYILMAHEGAYRLQRMAAMVEYAETPDLQVHLAFDRARTAYGWFHTAPMDAPSMGISSMLELRTYLKTLFSDEIVDALLGLDYYSEADGVLTASPFEAGEPLPDGIVSVIRENPTRIIYSRGVNYVYELVGERWLFTQFPVIE